MTKARKRTMKSVKKAAAALLCAVVLTACGQSGSSTGTQPPASPTAAEPQAHVHAPTDIWVCDFENHWRVCECGEELEKAAHTLDEVNCTVCGSEVVTWDDGGKQITVYNSYGDCSQFLYYEADGTYSEETAGNGRWSSTKRVWSDPSEGVYTGDRGSIT